MKNPNKSVQKINAGALKLEGKHIDIPPKTAITVDTKSIFLNNEVIVEMGDNTIIKDDEGRTVARIDSKYSQILSSNKLSKEETEKVVKEYMASNGIKSIKDIIAKQEKQEEIEIG